MDQDIWQKKESKAEKVDRNLYWLKYTMSINLVTIKVGKPSLPHKKGFLLGFTTQCVLWRPEWHIHHIFGFAQKRPFFTVLSHIIRRQACLTTFSIFHLIKSKFTIKLHKVIAKFCEITQNIWSRYWISIN